MKSLSLPKDLKEAEKILLESILSSINDSSYSRLSASIKFEGLRLLPVVLRLFKDLHNLNIPTTLLWPDAGSMALARRDMPDLSTKIWSISDYLDDKLKISSSEFVIVVSPQPYDYDVFFKLSEKYQGRILVINPKLEDPMVGIGSLARSRRKDFLDSWQHIFWLQPLARSAIMKAFPYKWTLFRSDSDGYREIKSFDIRPDSDLINEVIEDSLN